MSQEKSVKSVKAMKKTKKDRTPRIAEDEPQPSKQEAPADKKKKRKRDRNAAEDVKIDVVMDDSPVEDGPDNSTPKQKKRKVLDEGEEELEIDISAPEPPSKKALRKAKKLKTSSTSDSTPVQPPGSASEDPRPLQAASTSAATPQRSPFGVWIGNLPFAATKAMLSTFLTTNNIPASEITRIHLPAPQKAKATQTSLKPNNKGFAYVDLSTESAFYAALALSESHLGGRNVLIKDSKSFEGRPAKPADETSTTVKKAAAKQPTKRVFVGNLAFEVTVADLEEQLKPCGTIANVHMATFQDTGACKGYAWITFEDVAAAEAAVRGWVRTEGDDKGDTAEAENDEDEDTAAQKKKKNKTRKWFVNRMQGRELRCEFAEDASVRYKKRFGKQDSNTQTQEDPITEDAGPVVETVDASTVDASTADVLVSSEKSRKPQSNGMNPGAPSDDSMRRGRIRDASVAGRIIGRVVKANDLANKQAEAARYRTGAISQSLGKKIVFG